MMRIHSSMDYKSLYEEQLKKNEQLTKETNDLVKFIAGNYYHEYAVKEILKKVYTKEFIECNDERWNEIGLEFDDNDLKE